MKIRIVNGPGSPWEDTAIVDTVGIVIDGRGYCPLDDLSGIVVVEASAEERTALAQHGFWLDFLN